MVEREVDVIAVPTQSRTKLISQVTLLLIIVSTIAYLPVLDHGFFVDDYIYVGNGNRVLPALQARDVWRLLIQRGNPWEYLPVRDFTYWFDMTFIGIGADAFHLSDLIWYFVCCYGVYRLVVELISLYEPKPDGTPEMLALLVSLLFFLHPAHAEVVAWVSGRKDILATAFFSLGAAYYVAGIRRSWALKDLAIGVLLLLAAVFSKSVAAFAVLPLTLVALNARMWLKSGSARRVALFCALPILLGFFALAIHIRVGAETGIGFDNSVELLDLVERASRINATLLGIVFLPVRLRLIYDVYQLGAWHWLVSALTMASLVVSTVVLLAGKRSLVCVAVVIVVVPLLPYLQLSPYLTWSMASERFAFQATMGWALAFVCCFRMLCPDRLFVVSVLVAAFFAFELAPRVLQWESPRLLRESAIQMSPLHHSAVRELVVGHLLSEGDYARSRELSLRIQNARARDLMLRVIGAAESFQPDMANGAQQMQNYPVFCATVLALDNDLVSLHQAARHMPDVSYANFAEHLRAYLNRGIANVKLVCGT